MLTLTFLGVGGAFAKRNFQSNALIEAWASGPDSQDTPDDNLLIDFGTTGPLALHQLKDVPGFAYLNDEGRIRFPAIRRIFVSHQHADHVGGLEELACTNRFMYASPNGDGGHKPQLISGAHILPNLWEQTLRGGLGALGDRSATLEDYFEVVALSDNDGDKGEFKLLDRYAFSTFSTDHLRIHSKYDWPSLGLQMRDTALGESAFFSGDTRFDYPAYAPMMSKARINFHDVQLQEQANPVHALLSELQTMPEEVRKKTYLYHYDDHWDDPEFKCVQEQFAGFVVPQQRYVVFE